MQILGIETSCDDTSIAICQSNFLITHNATQNQDSLHEKYGGVVPEIASRRHYDIMRALLTQAPWMDVDLIAVTQGPGLVGSLLVGNAFARGLAYSTQRKIIPIHHIDAHLASVYCDSDIHTSTEAIYPALSLVLSGGHTMMFLQNSPMHKQLLATTQDDACGECFDKVAKVLGLGFPGGKQIEATAKMGDPNQVPMPKIMQQSKDFSYSGLKTHTLQAIHSQKYSIKDICASFQKAAFQQIIFKVKSALMENNQVKTLFVVGGVSANSYLNERLNCEIDICVRSPKIQYCTDNAAMVAAAAHIRIQNGHLPQDARSSYAIFSRSPLESLK